MKASVIIGIVAAVAMAVILYGFLAYVIRRHIKQDNQAGGAAPGEPADPCETCHRWYECNGVDKENCPLWLDYEEVTHGKKRKGN